MRSFNELLHKKIFSIQNLKTKNLEIETKINLITSPPLPGIRVGPDC